MGKNNKIFLVKGNEAIALGAMAAGCECYFAYPITPQSEIPELLSEVLVQAGGQFVQAESEIAAANMLLGATACGKRAMTSSSSPGIALKQEAISYMAGSQLPGVIVNICRGGPGLGSIDPSQGDYYQTTRGGGHGDYRTLTLAPASCQEAYDLTIRAFDLAFLYRNPVVVLGDAILGQMKEPIKDWKERTVQDGKGLDWSLSGARNRGPRLLKSLYLSDGALAGHNRRLQEKYQSMRKECDWEEYRTRDADLIVVSFGSMGRIAKSSVRMLREKKEKIGLFRPITLYPFPEEPLERLAAQGKRFLTVENNAGQMVDDVRLAIRRHADSGLHCVLPGQLANPEDLLGTIEKALPKKRH
ncbi:MAG: 3-methyl-2-oxobutanoate dehydrogenase subunit VorB [Desulfohalobiaceae bacterium]|nr:3-methyl-2-oxobutanoate dehydrogenase subunit VorB [Desulfohalobiaceae bacterium]